MNTEYPTLSPDVLKDSADVYASTLSLEHICATIAKKHLKEAEALKDGYLVSPRGSAEVEGPEEESDLNYIDYLNSARELTIGALRHRLLATCPELKTTTTDPEKLEELRQFEGEKVCEVFRKYFTKALFK